MNTRGDKKRDQPRSWKNTGTIDEKRREEKRREEKRREEKRREDRNGRMERGNSHKTGENSGNKY